MQWLRIPLGSAGEAIQLAYGTSMVLAMFPLVTETIHGGTSDSFTSERWKIVI